MKKFIYLLLLCTIIGHVYDSTASNHDHSQDYKVKKYVEQAVRYFYKQGAQKALQEFNNPRGIFKSDFTYIWVYSPDGITRAHGNKPEWVGKHITNLVSNGTDILEAKLKAVHNAKKAGWAEYQLKDKIRRNYVQKVIDKKTGKQYLIGAGYFVS